MRFVLVGEFLSYTFTLTQVTKCIILITNNYNILV